jgi:hypothetical protein
VAEKRREGVAASQQARNTSGDGASMTTQPSVASILGPQPFRRCLP